MMGGAGGGNSGNSSNDRIKKATQVTAVADSRIQAVIVTAPKDLMEQIGMYSESKDMYQIVINIQQNQSINLGKCLLCQNGYANMMYVIHGLK